MVDKIIKRTIEKPIIRDLFKGKSMIILGPRQVGKTTLLHAIIDKTDAQVIMLNGDNPEDREILNAMNSTRAKQLFPEGYLVCIDEAQRLENTGLTLKIIHDNCPKVQLVVTGSSSFELSDKIRESLTGRKFTWHLYPFSLNELAKAYSLVDIFRTLETRLIFGSYPDVINYAGDEKRILNEIVSDYLFKDVFRLREVRKPEGLENLVKALAFQVSHEVSYRELGNSLQLDKETVEKYIRLLEESMVIFRLGSYSRNLRNELKRSKKVYFYDNGIRNAIIQQFSPMNLRMDTGALWENFLIAERIKFHHYTSRRPGMYFWRTTSQQEIDYLEEIDGELFAFEFTWKKGRRKKFPKVFIDQYTPKVAQIITRNNFDDFVGLHG